MTVRTRSQVANAPSNDTANSKKDKSQPYRVGERIPRYEGDYTQDKFRDVTYMPCFYIIEPTICENFRFIKIGKCLNPQHRFAEYSRYYENKFKILYFLKFRKLDPEKNINFSTDFASKFEVQVKRRLKEEKINPHRGYEFYDHSKYKDILNVIDKINEENRNDTTIQVQDDRRTGRTVHSSGKYKKMLKS
jgi:Meiotically up-regulated gene 113